MLKYSLVENQLTDRQDDYSAMTHSLPAGNYQVKVVTQFTSGGTFLKTPKLFTYPKTLKVEN